MGGTDGAACRCKRSAEDDVYVPFRHLLKTGEHSFAVELPRQFGDREFVVAHMSLTPDYYSTQAAQLGLEDDEDFDAPIQYNIALSCVYEYARMAFPIHYNHPTGQLTTDSFVRGLNRTFGDTRPSHCLRPPVFVDWIDSTGLELGYDMNEYVPLQAQRYYNVDYDAGAHFDALPETVRDLPWANNNHLPTALGEDAVAATVRLRINIAPLTVVTFSNEKQLVTMGFDATQFGKRVQHNQYRLTNDQTHYRSVVAVTKPGERLLVTTCVVGALPAKDEMDVLAASVHASKKILLHDVLLVAAVNKALLSLAERSNLLLKLTRDPGDGTFRFAHPLDPQVRTTLHLDRKLAQRLGYLHGEALTKDTRPAPVAELAERLDVSLPARATALDTGLVVVTLKDATSANTVGASERLLTVLLPASHGTMDTSQVKFRLPPARVDRQRYGTSSLLAVDLNLMRIYDDKILRPFVWPTGAYVQGLLVGLAGCR